MKITLTGFQSPNAVGDTSLISTTGPGPVPGRYGEWPAAGGRGSWPGSHTSCSQKREARTVRCFTHRTRRCWAAIRTYNNRRDVCRESYSDLADWSVATISFGSAARLPFVLEPVRTIDNSEIIHACKQRHARTNFSPSEETCSDTSLVAHALRRTEMACDHKSY